MANLARVPTVATLMVGLVASLSAESTPQSSSEARSEKRRAFEVASIKPIQSKPRLLGGRCGATDDRPGTRALAALEEQLGLKLEQRREVPVDVMIIDRAQQPTEN